MTVTWNGRIPVTRTAPRALVPLVMRADLDAALVEAAAARRDRRPHRATGPLACSSTARSSSRSGERIRGRRSIGADGSASRAARRGRRAVRAGRPRARGRVPGRRAPATAVGRGRLALDWGPVPGSYGWVFPKGDLLSVGVIGPARRRGRSSAPTTGSSAERVGLGDVAPVTDTGHLTRVRDAGLAAARRDGCSSPGDAAGLLEPWTREGISYALRSGRLAGECAAAGAAGGLPGPRPRWPSSRRSRRVVDCCAASPADPELLQLAFAGAPRRLRPVRPDDRRAGVDGRPAGPAGGAGARGAPRTVGRAVRR